MTGYGLAMDEFLEANRRNWDDRVGVHLGPDGYSVEELIANPEHITDVVRFDSEQLGSVDGLRLLHSQCHIGTDTLSWARLGAQVTGFDFSPKAVAAARSIADRAGIEATFIESEVASASSNVDGEFDLVYTSVGAICWLPELETWASQLSSLLVPGGRFYIRDSHPILLGLDDDRPDGLMVPKYPYFRVDDPVHFSDEHSYLGSLPLTATDTYEWSHPISDIVNALLGTGLVLDRLDEHRHLDWKFLPSMVPDRERWLLPEAQRDLMPLQFSVHAHKPAEP